MKIVADTATLFAPSEGEKIGLHIVPVCVSYEGHTYRDYMDISPEDFLKYLEGGGLAVTSQPSVGDILDALGDGSEETILLTVGGRLSGGYMTAMGARNTLEHPERVHVVDSGSLGGPLRYLARKAVRLRDEKLPSEEILRRLKESIDSSASFVIPSDFKYLARSGRVTHLTSKIGGALRLLPVLTQTEDRKRITFYHINRSWNKAVGAICKRLHELHVNHDYLLSIAHAGTPERAQKVREWVQAQFADVETEILQLSPSLMTHGGPGCIVVQAIRK